jgi:hypothetical protein
MVPVAHFHRKETPVILNLIQDLEQSLQIPTNSGINHAWPIK